MSVANSESTSLPKSKERWWWILSLLVCLVVFGMVQFWLWNAKQVAEQNLARANAQLEVHQAIVSQEKDLQQQISLAKSNLTSDQRGLDRAFSSFNNTEMAGRLKMEFAKVATEGVIVARNSSRIFNWGNSQFIYSPDSTQELVVYVREFDSKKSRDSQGYTQTAMEPDQVFRFPVDGSKLIDFDCAVEKMKTGCRLRVELEGQNPQTMTFDGYRADGWFSNGQRPHGLHDPNVFQPNQIESAGIWYEQGLWLTIRRRSFTVTHQKSGTVKRIFLVIGLKSDRPYRISGDDEYRVQDFLDLEWDPEQGNYKSTLKK